MHTDLTFQMHTLSFLAGMTSRAASPSALGRSQSVSQSVGKVKGLVSVSQKCAVKGANASFADSLNQDPLSRMEATSLLMRR